jgi:hypothetical protein
MSIGYSGSNFGIISSFNSGNGTLNSIGDIFEGVFENIRNNTMASLSLILNGTNHLVDITIFYAQDSLGTKIISKKIISIHQSEIVNIELQSNFIKIKLELMEGSSTTFSLQTLFKNSVLVESPKGVLSTENNITNGTLTPSTTYTGSFENVSNYSVMSILLKSENIIGPLSGIIYIDFSTNGTTILKTFQCTVQDITSSENSFNPVQIQTIFSNYVRIRFENLSTTETLTDLNIIVLYHTSKPSQYSLLQNEKITQFHPTTLQQSILSAPTNGSILEGNSFRSIQSFQNSLNVNVKSPNTAFGEMLMAYNTPFLQFDFSNGRPLDEIRIYQNTNFTTDYGYSFENAKAIIKSNDGSLPQKIELKSNGFTKYKPGQGIDHRFTGRFPSGHQTFCDQYVGVFTPQDSLCYGYFSGSETEFSIRYQKFGSQQLDRIELIETSTTTGGTITFTITDTNGTTIIPVVINNGENINIIAEKCSTAINNSLNAGTFGFKCQYYHVGNLTEWYIEILSYGTNSSTISISSTVTNVSLTLSNIVSATTPTTQIFPQRDWNINTCKDMGSLTLNYERNPTGFILDPTKGNVFRIHFQYLGFGAITFFIEQNESDVLIPVHQIKFQNLNDNPSLKNPSMRIGIGIETIGSSQSGIGQVETASMSSFLQGKFVPANIYRSFSNILLTNTQTGVNSLSRDLPGIICGIQGMEIYESTNSDGSINENVNNTNIYFNTINFSINAKNTNTSSNIIVMLVKNPNSILPTPSSIGLNIEKRNDDTILFVEGVPITNTNKISLTDFTIVFEYTLIEQDSIVLDISNLNILMSPTDSYYLCFYGELGGTGNPTLDVSGSVSYSVNM